MRTEDVGFEDRPGPFRVGAPSSRDHAVRNELTVAEEDDVSVEVVR